MRAIGVCVLVTLVAGCGGGRLVSTADDASRAIDDIARGGKSADDFDVAANAAPVARAAIDDAPEVERLTEIVKEAGPPACDAVSAVDRFAEPVAELTEPLILSPAGSALVVSDAAEAGVPNPVTNGVLGTALDMAQSTWVQAAGALCELG